MPRSVIHSNWYYGRIFERGIPEVYLELARNHYHQIPAGSNYECKENFVMTVEYCKKHIAPEMLLGYLQAPWRSTLKCWRKKHIEAINAVKKAIKIWQKD
ncbi:MAG: hypothetical protein N2115_03165 [bacterium]|nr:hypothetical protein [bacterium]